MSEETKKARAFARFARTHKASPGMTIEDTFYDQACAAIGICNHSTWMRLDPNDNRWDDIFTEGEDVPTQTLGEPDETLPDIVAWIHRHANVYGHDLAERVDRASIREREMWRQRVADAMQVADQFKETLNHILNGFMFEQQKREGAAK